jgi:hypothetical protein
MRTIRSSLRALTRRGTLKLGAGWLISLGLWPGALRAQDNGRGGNFSFIAVNDLHYVDDACGAWFERVIASMKTLDPKPELCLVGGDWCEHGTRKEMAPVKAAFESLGIPVHGVIGNHDYTSDTDRGVYDELFPGALNYQFEHRGWTFLALDSSQGQKYKESRIQPATLQWLDERLPKLDRKKPVVVLTHFPLGVLTPYRPLNAEDLLERLKPLNLRAVFNGHFHGFTERNIGEATITTNRCCAISRKNHDGTKEKGYFVCQARDGVISRRFVEVKTG